MLAAKGSDNHNAKLHETLVREIMRRRVEEQSSLGDLADAFGVTKSAIQAIVNGTTWKHVTQQTPLDRWEERQRSISI